MTKEHIVTNSTKKNDELTVSSIISGFSSGCMGGLIAYPFEGWKKRDQSGQKLIFWPPREVYRGASSFALSLGPVSMIQLLAKKKALGLLPDDASPAAVNATTVVCGGIGALVSSPVEHIILTQQKNKKGPIEAIRHLVQQGYTHPWTGFKPLFVRECVFGFAMLSGAEQAGRKLSEVTGKDMMMAGSLLTGIVGATISHPFDTIATTKQNADSAISVTEAIKRVYAKGGMKNFFHGYKYRVCLFTICMVTIGYFNQLIESALQRASSNKNSFFKPVDAKAPSVINEADEEKAVRLTNRSSKSA